MIFNDKPSILGYFDMFRIFAMTYHDFTAGRTGGTDPEVASAGGSTCSEALQAPVAHCGPVAKVSAKMGTPPSN